jgi:hypothetical protein
MQINSLVGGPERGDGGGYSRVSEPREGWTVSQLVAHFGYSRTSIKRLLKLQMLSDLP